MANFTPAFLDEVLARADIVELIARHVELKKAGSNMMGLCPFHHEKTPSFSVSPDKQLYYCFGCGKGGGAFQFLMEHDGYTFPEAVEYLAEKAGLEVPKGDARPEDEQRRQRARELLARAADAFARALASGTGKSARSYIERRNLPDDIVRHYRLGFAPGGYGFLEKCFAKDPRTLAQLEAVGLLFRNDRGGYGDRFRDRLMFPICDRRGHIAGFGGRILGDGEPKYLNSPETAFFHKSDLLYGLAEHRDHIRRRKQLVVVEGYMDVLMLAAHELPIALAPLGTAISERQIREIFRLDDSPIFCFDGDRAGRQAAWRALERMLAQLTAELSPRFLYLPEGEDPDSLVQKIGSDGFVQQMDKTRPVLETWLTGLKNMAGKGAEGRARMAKKADQMLSQVNDSYLRQAWRQEVESATGIRLRTARSRAGQRKAVQPRGYSLEEKFLAALIQNPKRFNALPEDAGQFLLDGGWLHDVYTRAFGHSDQQTAAFIKGLIRAFPDDEPRISRWAVEAPVSESDFSDLLLAVQVNDLRQRIDQAHGDVMKVVKLKQELEELKSEQLRRSRSAHDKG